LRRTESVAIEGIADVGEALLAIGATRMTPRRHSAINFAVVPSAWRANFHPHLEKDWFMKRHEFITLWGDTCG